MTKTEVSTAITMIDHRSHPFELPSPGSRIVSPETGVSYHIGQPFDEGGFGTVFRCTDDWDDRLVAKVLRPVGEIHEMERRARSEVVAGAIARSPHIVHVTDAFIFRGAYYIISEYCEFSLRAMMVDSDYLRPVWFPSLAKSVLHGLHFMHTRGLAHCDVHEGNVLLHSKPCMLLGREQSALDFKLGDFGQARTIDNVDPSCTWNTSCVPPEVLAPEEFGPVDHRADLYQAGLLFLRFLTPAPLDFDADDILKGRPRELAETLLHPSAEFIAALLRRHATARPTNALDAWRAFGSATKLL